MPGSEIEFVGHCSTDVFSSFQPDFYGDNEDDIDDWFDEVDLSNNNHQVNLTFDIPNSATPGEYSFFIGNTIGNDNDRKFIRELIINIENAPPIIDNLSSYQFSADDQITISGSNLSNDGTIKFNDLQCSSSDIQSWGNSSIIVTVPDGVVSGVLTLIKSAGSCSANYQIISSTGYPEITQSIPDQILITGQDLSIGSLYNYFMDPNGDDLAFTINYDCDDLTYTLEENIVVFSSTLMENLDVSISIKAEDSEGEITDTFTISIIPPGPPLPSPTSLDAVVINCNDINLNWVMPSDERRGQMKLY